MKIKKKKLEKFKKLQLKQLVESMGYQNLAKELMVMAAPVAFLWMIFDLIQKVIPKML